MAALAPPKRFADLVAVSRLPAAARERPDPRAVDTVVLGLVEAGTGRYVHGASAGTARPASAFVVAPGEVHDVSGLWSTRGWLVEFPAGVVGMAAADDARYRPHRGHPAWLSFIRPTCLSGRLELDREMYGHWVMRARAIAADLEQRPVGYNQSVASFLALMLIDAARLALPGLAGAAQREAPLLQALFEEIEGRFDQGISLDDVARSIGISPGHLARVVKRTTGRTVNEWIAERRMVEARRQLLETEAKMDAVAKRAGFRDLSWFRRQFRAVHGTTPAEWRRLHRGGRSERSGGGS